MVEAEHNTVYIQMIESDWVITGVYSLNGHTITDSNKPLQLAGLGTRDSRCPSQLNDITFTVITPPLKQLKVTVDLEYMKQVYNYTLTLINNRTQEEKEITGEWIIEQPISYKETLELGELPER